jgi:DNA primase
MQESRIATWAGLSTSGMRSIALPPLPLASTVYIIADGDEPGEQAAQSLATRLYAEHRKVKIVRPVGVKDYNDLIQESAHV